jgi:hypothetical protein
MSTGTGILQTKGTVLSFTTDAIYGTLASPETGNFTANFLNALVGKSALVVHNNSAAPTFDSRYFFASGLSANYVTGAVNYIRFIYRSHYDNLYDRTKCG